MQIILPGFPKVKSVSSSNEKSIFLPSHYNDAYIARKSPELSGAFFHFNIYLLYQIIMANIAQTPTSRLGIARISDEQIYLPPRP